MKKSHCGFCNKPLVLLFSFFAKIRISWSPLFSCLVSPSMRQPVIPRECRCYLTRCYRQPWNQVTEDRQKAAGSQLETAVRFGHLVSGLFRAPGGSKRARWVGKTDFGKTLPLCPNRSKNTAYHWKCICITNTLSIMVCTAYHYWKCICNTMQASPLSVTHWENYLLDLVMPSQKLSLAMIRREWESKWDTKMFVDSWHSPWFPKTHIGIMA